MHILPMGSMGPSVRGNRCLLSPPPPPSPTQVKRVKPFRQRCTRVHRQGYAWIPLSIGQEGETFLYQEGVVERRRIFLYPASSRVAPLFFSYHAVKRDQSRCCSLAAEENTIFAAVTWTACARSHSFASSFFFLEGTTRCDYHAF